MPTLEWIGKSKVINHHQEVPFRVLERKYSFDENGQSDADNGSENMIIHGDNLEALKALLPRYEGRVKCIYIDPPYNTAKSTTENQRWKYNDNVDSPEIKKWIGQLVGDEGEDLSRHDKWLCMMYPRIKLLQKLLSKDGVIFISVDDNEVYNLKEICDEILGRHCFVANISWQRTYSKRNDSKTISAEVEHILVYSKQSGWMPKRMARTQEMNENYGSKDGDPREWSSVTISAPGAGTHQGMVYAIQHPITGELIYPPMGRCWSFGQLQMFEHMNEWTQYELRPIDDYAKRCEICGRTDGVPKVIDAIVLKIPFEQAKLEACNRYEAGIKKEQPWPMLYFTGNGQGGIRRKQYLESSGGRVTTNLWMHNEVGHTGEATNELAAIFGGHSPFDTPKPTRLIDRIIQIATDQDSIILDSFSGSGTTAHAVLNANKSDKGNRKFILIETMEYAETITSERVRRVISGYVADKETTLYDVEITAKNLAQGAEILEEAKKIAKDAKKTFSSVKMPKVENGHLIITAVSKSAQNIQGTGGNFSYYELGEPLLIGDCLNEAVSVDKIREYVWFMETKAPYVPVSGDNPYYLGQHNHTGYYFYYEPQKVTVLDYAFLATITEKNDGTIIYADRCSIGEDKLNQMGIVFKKIPRDISRL